MDSGRPEKNYAARTFHFLTMCTQRQTGGRKLNLIPLLVRIFRNGAERERRRSTDFTAGCFNLATRSQCISMSSNFFVSVCTMTCGRQRANHIGRLRQTLRHSFVG